MNSTYVMLLFIVEYFHSSWRGPRYYILCFFFLTRFTCSWENRRPIFAIILILVEIHYSTERKAPLSLKTSIHQNPKLKIPKITSIKSSLKSYKIHFKSILESTHFQRCYVCLCM